MSFALAAIHVTASYFAEIDLYEKYFYINDNDINL